MHACARTNARLRATNLVALCLRLTSHLLRPSTTQAIARAVATAEVSFAVDSNSPTCLITGWGQAQSPVATAYAQVRQAVEGGRRA